jgi:uncharacterized protein
MTTLREVSLRCPVCATWFQAAAMDQTSGCARTSTDFHRRIDGAEPVAYEVDLCTACGFAGPRDDFASDPVSATSAAALEAREATTSTVANVTASEKYEAAAARAERRGEGRGTIAELLLRAAWCCVHEQDAEAERFFRRGAAREYESALSRYDDVPRAQRAELTYLVGELWRRVGDGVRARVWLERVAEEVVDEKAQHWLVRLAEQQRETPREWMTTGEYRAAA